MPVWEAEEARAAIEAQITAWTTCVELLDVRVDGDHIAVEFAVPDQPGCRFGFRWPVVGDPSTIDVDDHAMMARVNLEEWVEAADLTLPDCIPGEIAWIPAD